ncbi:MAG: agmatinase [Rhodanobacteraceae bacterium]
MLVKSSLDNFVGSAGIATFFRAPHTADLRDADVVVIGNPFDSGTSNRPGARFGPRAMREQSLHICAYPTLYPWEYPLTERCRLIDGGDAVGIWGVGATEGMIAAQRKAAELVFEAGAALLVLGGDHTGPYGPMRAAAARFGPLAMIHIDAHQDSDPTPNEVNHGKFAWDLAEEGVIDDARSVQAYIRTVAAPVCARRYNILYAEEALALGADRVAARIREVVGEMPVYLTFDIDGIDPSCAPGTGTPVWGGPSVTEIRRVLRALRGVNIIAADVVEVSPPYDAPNQMTAVAGATIAADLAYLMYEAKTRRRSG